MESNSTHPLYWHTHDTYYNTAQKRGTHSTTFFFVHQVRTTNDRIFVRLFMCFFFSVWSEINKFLLARARKLNSRHSTLLVVNMEGGQKKSQNLHYFSGQWIEKRNNKKKVYLRNILYGQSPSYNNMYTCQPPSRRCRFRYAIWLITKTIPMWYIVWKVRVLLVDKPFKNTCAKMTRPAEEKSTIYSKPNSLETLRGRPETQ